MNIFTSGLLSIILIIIIAHYAISLKIQKKLYNDGKSPNLFLGIILIICMLSLFIPFLIKHYYNIKFTTTGEIGDIIGGSTAPILGIIGIIVTFYAFWIQFKANILQQNEFARQDKATKIDRFESKFYSFINIHRENVRDVEIAKKIIGRKAFLSMFNELRYTYLVTEEFYFSKYNNNINIKISDDVRYNISYCVFFFGIGRNSSKIIHDLIPSKYSLFTTGLIKHLIELKKNFNKEVQKIAVQGIEFEFKLQYVPFDGHTTKLSHYIRHLFQTVNFVDNYSVNTIDLAEKKKYMKTFRAQLSIYEQLFIYYNSLSILGKPWIELKDRDETLLEKYTIVKSIPLPLADFYIKPKDMFKNEKNLSGDDLFEWDTIKNRISEL